MKHAGWIKIGNSWAVLDQVGLSRHITYVVTYFEASLEWFRFKWL